MLKLVRFVNLLLGALNLGLAWAHVVEMRPKRAMCGAAWLTTQQAYSDFGKVSSVAFPASLISTLLTLVLVRGRQPTAALTTLGAACTVATVAIWARYNEPVNQEIAAWQSDALPANWAARRDQWEFAHATSAALHAAGYVALLAAALGDGEANRT